MGGGFRGGGPVSSGGRRWAPGSGDPAPAPTDSPTVDADMQAAAAAVLFLLAGEETVLINLLLLPLAQTFSV